MLALLILTVFMFATNLCFSKKLNVRSSEAKQDKTNVKDKTMLLSAYKSESFPVQKENEEIKKL